MRAADPSDDHLQQLVGKLRSHLGRRGRAHLKTWAASYQRDLHERLHSIGGTERDVGVRIAGARKMTWRPGTLVTPDNLADVEANADAYKVVLKENVFPPFDADAERAKGVTAGAAYLKKKLLDAVAAGPGSNGALARKRYVEGAGWLLNRLAPLRTVAEVTDFIGEWSNMVLGLYLQPEKLTGEELVRRFGGTDPSGTLYIHVYTPEAKLERARLEDLWLDALRGQRKEEADALYEQKRKIRDAAERRLSVAALRREGLAASLRRLEDEELYQLYRKVPTDQNYAGEYAAVLAGIEPDKNVAKAKRSRLANVVVNKAGTFHRETVPHARRLESTGDWSELAPRTRESTEPPLERWERATTNQRRTGPATGVPKDVTSSQFASEFSFRGNQFGRWVTDDEVGEHVRLAYEAFADLAALMGLPRKAMSSFGQLGMAFGARGQGRFKAHYEPQQVVINLTNTRGDGSLAHEWGHFLDHHLLQDPKAFGVYGRVAIGTTASAILVPRDFRTAFVQYASKATKLAADLAPEVESALRAVMAAIYIPSPGRREQIRAQREQVVGEANAKALEILKQPVAERAAGKERLQALLASAPDPNQTKFAHDAELMGDYWYRPTELFARAFESWAEDKLASNGRMNTYLVYGTRVPYRVRRRYKGIILEGINPYPEGAEREDINLAMDRFVTAIAKHGLPKR